MNNSSSLKKTRYNILLYGTCAWRVAHMKNGFLLRSPGQVEMFVLFAFFYLYMYMYACDACSMLRTGTTNGFSHSRALMSPGNKCRASRDTPCRCRSRSWTRHGIHATSSATNGSTCGRCSPCRPNSLGHARRRRCLWWPARWSGCRSLPAVDDFGTRDGQVVGRTGHEPTSAWKPSGRKAECLQTAGGSRRPTGCRRWSGRRWGYPKSGISTNADLHVPLRSMTAADQACRRHPCACCSFLHTLAPTSWSAGGCGASAGRSRLLRRWLRWRKRCVCRATWRASPPRHSATWPTRFAAAGRHPVSWEIPGARVFLVCFIDFF